MSGPARSGPNSTFEEDQLAIFLVQTAKLDYSHTKQQVLTLVQKTVESNCRKQGCRDKCIQWLVEEVFVKTFYINSEGYLSIKYPRAFAMTPEVLDKYSKKTSEEKNI